MENSGTITFRFSGGSECAADLNPQERFIVGLDNNYRLNSTGELTSNGMPENHVALRGRWLNDKTFLIEFQALEEGLEMQYTATFEDDRIEWRTASNADDAESVVQGRLQ